MVPRGGLEPPRREALTPEASVSTNSTTEAYTVDAVHIIRRAQVRQQRIAKYPSIYRHLNKCSAITQLVRRFATGTSTQDKIAIAKINKKASIIARFFD